MEIKAFFFFEAGVVKQLISFFCVLLFQIVAGTKLLQVENSPFCFFSIYIIFLVLHSECVGLNIQ